MVIRLLLIMMVMMMIMTLMTAMIVMMMMMVLMMMVMMVMIFLIFKVTVQKSQYLAELPYIMVCLRTCQASQSIREQGEPIHMSC